MFTGYARLTQINILTLIYPYLSNLWVFNENIRLLPFFVIFVTINPAKSVLCFSIPFSSILFRIKIFWENLKKGTNNYISCKNKIKCNSQLFAIDSRAYFCTNIVLNSSFSLLNEIHHNNFRVLIKNKGIQTFLKLISFHLLPLHDASTCYSFQ